MCYIQYHIKVVKLETQETRETASGLEYSPEDVKARVEKAVRKLNEAAGIAKEAIGVANGAIDEIADAFVDYKHDRELTDFDGKMLDFVNGFRHNLDLYKSHYGEVRSGFDPYEHHYYVPGPMSLSRALSDYAEGLAGCLDSYKGKQTKLLELKQKE